MAEITERRLAEDLERVERRTFTVKLMERG